MSGPSRGRWSGILTGIVALSLAANAPAFAAPQSEGPDEAAPETEAPTAPDETAPETDEAGVPEAAEPDAPTTEPTVTSSAATEAPAPQTSGSVAEQQAEAGRAYYGEDNYVAALDAFRASFEDTPTAATAYNIARCHERLSQWGPAIEWYERYIELETNPREQADAREKVAFLQTRLGATGETDPYEARMVSGRRAYQRGNFEAAIEDFQAAFDVRAEPGALYNIAKAYEKMARYEDALEFYGQYLELAPNAPDKADVEAIMTRLRRDLKARFQELSISSTPPGAEVYLDERNDGIIGQTPLHTKLPPGPHRIYIEANGYKPIERAFVMPDDKPLALDLALEELENVGYVTLDVDQAGARIFIDGAIVGLSPFTQKKALEAGEHQVVVELVGYDRYSRSFTLDRDGTTALDIDLNKYNPPVSDGTLDDWGRNLLLFGLIGGGLGFGGPILYQEVILGKPYSTSLGPENTAGMPYYDPDNPSSLRTNDELDTLETVQTVSLIAGGTLVVGGLIFYMYKWFRDTPPPPVTAATEPSLLGPAHAKALDGPSFELTGFGVTPDINGGATLGLSGRF